MAGILMGGRSRTAHPLNSKLKRLWRKSTHDNHYYTHKSEAHFTAEQGVPRNRLLTESGTTGKVQLRTAHRLSPNNSGEHIKIPTESRDHATNFSY